MWRTAKLQKSLKSSIPSQNAIQEDFSRNDQDFNELVVLSFNLINQKESEMNKWWRYSSEGHMNNPRNNLLESNLRVAVETGKLVTWAKGML